MSCLQCWANKQISPICVECEYGTDKGVCTYGTPVCKHDYRLACRFKERKT